MLKMPKVKAYENGELEIIPGHENGWTRVHPRAGDRPSMTTVFHADHDDGMELVVTCSILEYGESVYVILVPAHQGMLHDECYIADHVGDRDEGSSEMEDALAYTVNVGFANLAGAYNETKPDYSNCE